MRVEILTVGDELLSGHVVNGNAAWLGRTLTEAGFEVGWSTVVGDDPRAITAAATAALGRADALVVTGGLGPTSDDVTADALAPLAVGPDGIAALPNRVGSATGLRIEAGDGVVYAVPGVPQEMAAMVLAAVLPDLSARGGRATVTVTRTLHVPLLGESATAARLAPMEKELREAAGRPDGAPRLAYLASPGEVLVRLTVSAPGERQANERLTPWVGRAGALIGDEVSGVDERLEETVRRLLAERGATVAAAESLTGGLIGATLTAVAGSSATFRGGLITYATELKAELLGVDRELLARHGAVHPEVARQMAAGVRDRLGADYGLGVTGVAGPNPQDGQPPGTVHVAVAGPAAGVTAVVSPWWRGNRERIRTVTVTQALDLLRRHVLGLPHLPEQGI